MSDPRVDAIVAAVLKELQSQVPTGAPGTAVGLEERAGPAGGRSTVRQRRSVPENLKISILGAGHGGLAMAGHLALLGGQVTLFSFFDRELAPVAERGGIEVRGEEVSGFGRMAAVTRCIDQAVKGADLIMICAPAFTHVTYASLLAGLLEDEQVVVLNPGRTGGALEFAQVLRRFALRARIYLAEAQTFMYAAEMRGPGQVEILKEKFTMRVAALPATDTAHVVEVLRRLYPQIEPARNVLETSINNVGPVNHPAPMLLNTAVIERAAQGEDLRFYRDMINPTISNLVLERIDEQRMAVGQALGLEVWSVARWYRESYGVTGNSLYEIYQNNRYYLGFSAPTHILAQNNVLDEVPNSLVPLATLGRQLGVATPTIDVIVNLACVMCEIDFWHAGRTPDKLGLAGLTAAQMLEHVENQALLGSCARCGVCRRLPQFR